MKSNSNEHVIVHGRPNLGESEERQIFDERP